MKKKRKRKRRLRKQHTKINKLFELIKIDVLANGLLQLVITINCNNTVKTNLMSLLFLCVYICILSNCPKLSGLHGFPAPGSQCGGCWEQGQGQDWSWSWSWSRGQVYKTGPSAGGWLLDPYTPWHSHPALPLGGRHPHTL